MTDPRRLESKRRYREKNREKIREWNREYAHRKAREAGIPELGSPESTANRRAARKAKGEEHGNWKGDQAGYQSLHQWLARHATKTGTCSVCGKSSRTQWANLSGEYRRDLDDFAEMCSSCHKRYDMAKARGVEPPKPGEITHGASAYSHYGCRCDVCRQGQRDRARDYARRKRSSGLDRQTASGGDSWGRAVCSQVVQERVAWREDVRA